MLTQLLLNLCRSQTVAKAPFAAVPSFRQGFAIVASVSAARSCSMLDPEGSVEHKSSSSFPKVFLIPLAMLLAIAALLLLAFSATQQKETDFYTFKVVNIRGKLVSLEKYRGSVSPHGGGQLSGASSQSLHVCGNQVREKRLFIINSVHACR